MFGLFKKSWEKRLTGAKPDALRDGLAGVVVDALREDDRVSAVRATSPMSLAAKLGDGEHQLFLYNIATELEAAAPADRVDVLRRFLRSMDGTPPTVRDLVPVVKTAAWVADARAMIEQQSPPEKIDDNALATAPLGGDLVVVYAFDRPDSMAFATRGQLRELGVDVEGLLEPAKRTLRERLPPLTVQRGPRSCMVTCGGNFEACVLLFDDLLDQIAPSFAGDLVAIAAARDVLVLTGTEVDGGVAEIVGAAERVHDGGNYLLSTSPLRRTAAGWVPLRA